MSNKPKVAKEKKAPALSPLQMRMTTLQNVQFKEYLTTLFGTEEKIQEVPQDQLDFLYKTFCAGYNCGIIQTAGDMLSGIGLDLNVTSRNVKTPKKG